MNARIQLVEDDQALAQILTLHFEDLGHEVFHASCIKDAKHQIDSNEPDLILMDQGLPDGKGFDLLSDLIDIGCRATIVMITSEHDLDLAIAAIKTGAFDFVHKPIKTDELNHTVNRALQHRRLSSQVQALSTLSGEPSGQPRLLGQSQAMLGVSKEIALVADSPARVLINGESGTGKELVARAIHQHSQRATGPFLAVNCATLVGDLLESELFGHEKGAFTGAAERKTGKFELAADGTLFLDEIGELALPLQAKLLRVLQEGTFERVGGTQQLTSNTRVIAATNRNLQEEIEKGTFREDLYYRLNTMQIKLPPLRERKEDLDMLIRGLLDRICRTEGKPQMEVSPSAKAVLKHHNWPGNVRELENVLNQAVLRNRGTMVDESHINLGSRDSVAIATRSAESNHTPESLAEMEAKHIQYTLDFVSGHKGKACELLDISRPALDRKIEKYGLLLKSK